MKHFSQYGLNEFIVCGGYKIDIIKQYFMDFYIYQSDITVDLQNNVIETHKKSTENWNVTVVDTGLFSSTGQRVSMIRKYIEEDTFIVTYGDCISDIDILQMVKVHNASKKMATIAMAKPVGRNQLLQIDDDNSLHFEKNPQYYDENGWIMAECFIFNKKVFTFLQGNYDLEKQLFVALSERKELATYKHRGFWAIIETKRNLIEAQNLWNADMAPWIKGGESI